MYEKGKWKAKTGFLGPGLWELSRFSSVPKAFSSQEAERPHQLQVDSHVHK